MPGSPDRYFLPHEAPTALPGASFLRQPRRLPGAEPACALIQRVQNFASRKPSVSSCARSARSSQCRGHNGDRPSGVRAANEGRRDRSYFRRHRAGRSQSLSRRGGPLRPLLENIDGFLSIERFQSLTTPGKVLSLSFWRDEEAGASGAIAATPRRAAPDASRSSGLSLARRARLRDYGMNERQWPRNSRKSEMRNSPRSNGDARVPQSCSPHWPSVLDTGWRGVSRRRSIDAVFAEHVKAVQSRDRRRWSGRYLGEQLTLILPWRPDFGSTGVPIPQGVLLDPELDDPVRAGQSDRRCGFRSADHEEPLSGRRRRQTVSQPQLGHVYVSEGTGAVATDPRSEHATAARAAVVTAR